MKEHEDIDQKIANLLSGNATHQDEKDIDSWSKMSDKNQYQFGRLKQFWKDRTADLMLINHENQKSQIWHSFQNEIGADDKVKRRFISMNIMWKAAAVILILLIPASYLIHKFNIPAEEQIVAHANDMLRYNPSGQKSQIQLSDGSKVWLNAESSISYTENFTDSTRVVKLDGEAFFEVKSDSLRPFYVEAGKIKVAVLGTGFNVSAYQDEPEIVVALIHGSVKVSVDSMDGYDYYLSPGFAVSYSKENNTRQTTSLNDNPLFFQKVTSWKEGVLVFDGQNFESFVMEISRWYGLEVSVSGSPPDNWQIRASFTNEYLNNILDAVSFNKDFRYELNNKELKLIFN